MVNSVNERDELSSVIEFATLTSSGDELSLDKQDAKIIAEEVLDAYLIVRKDSLPEAKLEGHMIYAGNQAVSDKSSVDDLMEKALSFLSAASKLVLIEEARRAEEKREQDEILTAFNSIAHTKRTAWSTMTANEQLAGREIIRLRGLAKKFF
jgi:hypothetical protein